MTHDPLCPFSEAQLTWDHCPYCDVIATVRAEERAPNFRNRNNSSDGVCACTKYVGCPPCPNSTPRVVAEFTTMFAAGTQEDADTLLERVFDAVHEVVCPPGDAQFQPCGWCKGSAVNPAAEGVATAGGAWTPGHPCAVCANTSHPGLELPCTREHVEVATVHTDGAWVTTGDRVNLHVLRDIVAALDSGKVEEARRIATAEIEGFTDGTGDGQFEGGIP